LQFNCTHINATDLPDAWFQSIYKVIEIGRDFRIDRGSYAGSLRLEFDWFSVQIKQPWATPMLPQLPAHYGFPNPVESDFIDEYLPYLMTGEEKEGESYTYGQRICNYPIPDNFHEDPNLKDLLIDEIEELKELGIIRSEVKEVGIDTLSGLRKHLKKVYFLNQMELLNWTYSNKGERNNQMVLQVAHPSDMLIKDPPCLSLIDTRIQDGKIIFFPYFRSWDLWGGFPANLQAIEMMKQYVASMIGVENGEMIASSKGLHIYKYAWELSEMLRGKTIEEFRAGE